MLDLAPAAQLVIVQVELLEGVKGALWHRAEGGEIVAVELEDGEARHGGGEEEDLRPGVAGVEHLAQDQVAEGGQLEGGGLQAEIIKS